MIPTIMANKESTSSFNESNQTEIEKHRLCVQYSKFSDFGWESLYKQYKSNVIKMINTDNNLSRLYIIRQLDLSSNSFESAVAYLKFKKQNQLPEFTQLINNLKDMFPDSDPIYLDLVGEYYGFDESELGIVVEKMISKEISYPKLSDYNDHLKTMSIIKNLTVDFTVETFLNLCPDPVNYFKNVKFNSSSTHFQESLSYLCHKFDEFAVSSIRAHLDSHQFNLTDTVEALSNSHDVPVLRNKRKTIIRPYHVNFKTTENVEFLKEAAFNDHKEEILNYINTQKTNREIKFKEAKSIGNLSTCECCYDDELLTTEVYSCPAGHKFCAPCLNKFIEIAISSNKIKLECLAFCDEEFDIMIIKAVVDDKLYQRIMRLKQVQEIKKADIEGLETCAFCDYSIILPPDLKIIQCLNPECKKKTCRDCREESHLPYKCDEVEKAPELRVRLMIENKMTEVLVRTCYYCNNKFVKEDGCNKMTCVCGSQMCYICRKPVGNNYIHFYQEIKIKDLCPLYTNEILVHSIAVEAAARLTVAELKASQPEVLNKIDIEKILPEFKKFKNIKDFSKFSISDNELLVKILGHNFEDINNLKDMRLLEPQVKKKKN